MNSSTTIKSFDQINRHPERKPLPPHWKVDVIINDDNMTYIVANTETKEAILVDPMREDTATIQNLARKYLDFRWLMVIDTHTHADHVTSGPELAVFLKAPWILHEKSPSRRIDLRVSRDVTFPSQAGGLRIFTTPGHTPDSLCIQWGPTLLTGDTLMYNDTGRNDLPGGDPAAHYESLLKLRKEVSGDTWILVGHDGEGGRADTWGNQMSTNPMLKLDRDSFIKEAGSYVGPSPKNLKESLFENFK